MPIHDPPSPARRRALSVFANTVVAAAGALLTGLLGLFAVKPSAAARGNAWVRAGKVTDLVPDAPVPRVLSVAVADGWYRDRSRATVFLVWDGASRVRGLSATCTHLGCQVRWDAGSKKFLCPCHGGEYDASGRVIAGPPPRPLDVVETRIDPATRDVLVRV